jgi:hypothetical protein
MSLTRLDILPYRYLDPDDAQAFPLPRPATSTRVSLPEITDGEACDTARASGVIRLVTAELCLEWAVAALRP